MSMIGDQHSARQTDTNDIVVGENLRRIRLAMGFSQEALAGEVGLSFQQIQKYEWGANRLSAGRMVELAKVLGVEVADFFQGTGATKARFALPPITSRDMEVVHAFQAIVCPKQRGAVLRLMRTMAQAED
jgi:transcriptional regulator with XRE-family HTH domain